VQKCSTRGNFIVLPFVLGAAMTGVAQLSGHRSLLFPEGVSLAWGAWAMGRPDWCRLGWRLVAAPVLCAACGLAAAILLSSRLAAEIAALSAAFVVLAALRAWPGPALSAAVLPTVAGVDSWAYALSVLVITAVIGGGVLIRNRLVRDPTVPSPPGPAAARASPLPAQPASPSPGASPPPAPPASPVRPGLPGRLGSPARPAAAWVVAAAWLAVAAGLGLPLAASAPPLLVSGFEWINGGGRRGAREGIRLAAVLTVTWTIGAVIAAHVPSVVAGALTLLAVAALIRVTRVTHAPVLAIGLVPLVLGAPSSPGGVAAGACAIASATAVLFLFGSLARMSPGATWLRRIIASAITRSQP
jgi:hypothetical protein